MAELKTKKTDASVAKFLNGIADEQTRADCLALVDIMRQITKSEPKMWGSSIIGFGDYRYKYASGREGDWFLTGFSPRKTEISFYITGCLEGDSKALATLGKYKSGKGCLYVKRLADIHLPSLKTLIRESVSRMKKKAKA
ncbi:MAG TPA: DUF1801 domain-containing protein [bacterium]|nr:DUF1801 domain-containing protein [bacterium]